MRHFKVDPVLDFDLTFHNNQVLHVYNIECCNFSLSSGLCENLKLYTNSLSKELIHYN